jgi:mannose-6-phosphate isomerase-like protein (cupin superfamily)
MISFVDLGEVIESIETAWSPVAVAYVNDQVVRAALFHGEYHWHKHDEEDELFFVYRGSIRIHLEDQEAVQLEEGQLCVVPKGIMHKPESDEPSAVLLFELSKLKSRGD